MKLTNLILAGVGAATILITTSAQAQVLAAWTFENDSIATNNTPAPSSGTGTADAIGLTNSYGTPGASTNTDDVLAGASGDTGVNTVANLTHEWRIRGGGSNNGWSSLAPIATQGAQFFASTTGASAGATGVKISFDWYVTNQAETNLEALYTTNGGTTWTNLPLTLGGSDSGVTVQTGSSSDSNTVNGSYLSVTPVTPKGQDWFTGLTATITDPSVLNDSGFGIELVNASTGADVIGASGGAYNNTSGNWRFDNVSIQAVPEPGSWTLGLCATALLGGFGLFRTMKSAKRA